MKSNINILNLFTEPLTNKELSDIFSKQGICLHDMNKNEYKCYNIMTKHTKSGYWLNKKYIKQRLNEYIHNC